MRTKIRGTEIHVSLWVIFVPPLILVTGCFREYLAAFISILLHEIGHIAAANLFGCRLDCLRFTPLGFTASLNDRKCSRAGSIILYFAGPAANLLIFGIGLLASVEFPAFNEEFKLISLTNLLLALFNLMPVFPLDGGRIMLEILAGSMGLLAAGKLLRRVAFIFSVTVLAAGFYLLYLSAFNFSLAIIGLYFIVLLRTGRMENAFMNIRQMIYRRSKLLKKGIYPARDLVVLKSTLVSEAIKSMDFDRFHLIYVLDEHLQIHKILTENEIMDAITHADGNDTMTFELLFDEGVKPIEEETT